MFGWLVTRNCNYGLSRILTTHRSSLHHKKTISKSALVPLKDGAGMAIPVGTFRDI